MAVFESLKTWARKLKRDAVMLYFACRHPDTPLLVKGWCFFTVAYALSPIDLVPDFIPILGYIDEVILLPAMIWVAVYFLPAPVSAFCRTQAEQWMEEQHGKPKSYLGAALIILIWITLIYFCWRWLAG